MQLNFKCVIFLSILLTQFSSAFALTSKLEKVDDNSFKFETTLSSGLKIKDIPVAQRTLDKHVVLQFRFADGIKLEAKSGNNGKADLESKQFKELMAHSFELFKRNQINAQHIQIDANFVDHYRSLIVSTIKNSSCDMQYIESKNECITKLLRLALKGSKLTYAVCKIIIDAGPNVQIMLLISTPLSSHPIKSENLGLISKARTKQG